MGRAHSARSQTPKSWSHPAPRKFVRGPPPGPGPWCPRPKLPRAVGGGESQCERLLLASLGPGLPSSRSPAQGPGCRVQRGEASRHLTKPLLAPLSLGWEEGPEVAEKPGFWMEAQPQTQPLPPQASLPLCGTSPPPLTSSSGQPQQPAGGPLPHSPPKCVGG